MDWKCVLHEAGIVLKDSVIDCIEQQCREEVAYTKEWQRKNDIIAAIMGFIDLKASDMNILELLEKHYGIDSVSEGKKYIFDARSFYQCNKLKAYLGISGATWVRYKNEHKLLDKLKSNPKLLQMPVEKLKSYIEKNNSPEG